MAKRVWGDCDSPMRAWAKASARAEGWEWEWGGWAGAGGGGTCWDWGWGAWVGRDSPWERVEEAEEEVEEPCRELLIQVSGDCWGPVLSLDTASSSEEEEESGRESERKTERTIENKLKDKEDNDRISIRK